MRYGSVCSGIEAASVAWEPLGWQPAWFAEIEPFPAAVLAHRWSAVPNHGDITKFKEWPDATIDILVGGTPCQSFSVAGLRKGLADPRGNLMLTYLAIAARYRPRWLVWENVPGVLSSNGGRDFGSFLAGLGQLGYGFAYRVLDAQHFGVPQRRRRVFVVGCLGSWQRAAAVLFERESLQRDTGAGGAAQEDPAAATGNRAAFRMRGFGDYVADHTASTLKARDCKDTSDLIVVHGRQDPCVSDKAYALNCQHSGNTNVLCIRGNIIDRRPENGGNGLGIDADGISPTLTATDRHAVAYGAQVRRLTPTECERLQGFPDGHTLIPWRGKPAAECPDGPRYKALGNSMAVPVMRWIGERIRQVSVIE
ncbi:MAG: DNA cytosine methyltransferase [Eikenella sp.]|nr:DNA cytosine methyltransferase [Eikenella sp.]